MSDVDQPPKIVQVTSSRPAEGKTTVAISLAISAASSGLNVALVDADLRHPATSRFFKLEKEQGLVDLLKNTVAITTMEAATKSIIRRKCVNIGARVPGMGRNSTLLKISELLGKYAIA